MSLSFDDEPRQVREREDLDALLHSYFAAQIPKSWPQVHETLEFSEPLSSMPARRRIPSGRYALAASLLLLLAGQSLLSGLFTGLSAPRPDHDKGWMEATKPRMEPKSTRPASAHSTKPITTERAK